MDGAYDAPTYAAGLASALAARGLSCRFDQWGSLPGKAIPEQVLRHLRQSAMLVVVATQEAGRSAAVKQEIEEFIPTERLIVPIDVDGSIQSAIWWLLLEGLAVSRDLPPPVKEIHRSSEIPHHPSSEVVDRIVNSIDFTRRNRRIRSFAGGAFALFVLFLVGIGVTYQQLRTLKEQKQRTDDKLRDTNGQLHDTSGKLSQTLTDLDTKKVAANQLRTSVTGLTEARNKLTSNNSLLSQRNSSLQVQNNSLEQRGSLLRTRIAARKALEADPVIAYRLAQKAYVQGVAIDSEDRENRELLLTAVSQLEFPYQDVLKGCSVGDFQSPYALLRCSEAGTEKSLLRVLNSDTMKIADTGREVDDYTGAAIYPVSDSWRMLTWHNLDRSDGPPRDKVFELWDSNAKPIGKPLVTTPSGTIFQCSQSKAAIYQPNVSWYIWDISSDRPIKVNRNFDTGSQVGVVFLGCRADGRVAIGGHGKVSLFDTEGSESKQYATPADLTLSESEPPFTAWSQDSRFLAIVDSLHRGPFIWNPESRCLTLLGEHSPKANNDGQRIWAVDAIAWDHNHAMAYSGHTEFQRNGTIEVWNADLPGSSARVLQHTNTLVEPFGLAFSPDGQEVAVAYESGNVSVLRASDGTVLGTGRHMDVETVRWSGDHIFSSTRNFGYGAAPNEIRVWSNEALFRNGWTFISSPGRHYGMCVATDAKSLWHAVSHTGASDEYGVEVREVQGELAGAFCCGMSGRGSKSVPSW